MKMWNANRKEYKKLENNNRKTKNIEILKRQNIED